MLYQMLNRFASKLFVLALLALFLGSTSLPQASAGQPGTLRSISGESSQLATGTTTTQPDALTVGTWSGIEDLSSYNKLTFIFRADGTVTMIDALHTKDGFWAQEGDRVALIITGAAAYHGTIRGSTFSGYGRDDTRTWNFSVHKSN